MKMQNKKKFMYVCLTLILAFMLTMGVAANTVMIFIEAETGTAPGPIPMNRGSGEGAFNGTFIYGDISGFGAHEDDVERILYTFEISEAGYYYIWFRLMGQGAPYNSFFARINGEGFDQETGILDEYSWYAFDMWEESDGYEYSDNNPFLPSLENHLDIDWLYNPNWHWIPFAHRDHSVDPHVRHILVTQHFDVGTNTIELMTREPMTYLDKILITNDLSFDPRAIDGDPEAYLAALAADEAEAATEDYDDETITISPVTEAAAPQTSDNFIIIVFIALAAVVAVKYKKQKI